MAQLKLFDTALRSAMVFSKGSSKVVLAFTFALVALLPRAHAFDAETMGFAALRREQPSLTGAGIFIAHPEAQEATNAWQVDPFNANVAKPVSLFAWRSAQGTATTFPNTVGLVSGHATFVGSIIYGITYGIAPGVAHVDNYDSDYFYEEIVVKNTAIQGQVVNQSFVFGPVPSTNAIDTTYDNFAATYNVLFVSGAGNTAETPGAPGTAYNSIAVGRYSGSNYTSSVGPSADGRAKPDIVALENATSYTAPLVSGAAALLWQAGARNDGGAGTASLATNSATLKALLLNGAIKPPGWTNGPARPLDARWGAGVVNVYNSYQQLRGGRRTSIAQSNVSAGGAHPPTSDTANIASLRGWDSDTLNSSVLNDRVAHYFFDLPTSGGAFTFASTLVWKKESALSLPNFDLFLYETRSNTLVASSVSSVDNVEHLFAARLPAGRYDLQVLKRGGVGQMGSASYSLAFDFAPLKLQIARAGSNVLISWPISEAAFTLQAASNLNSPIAWENVSVPIVITNLFNTVTLPLSPSPQFFRLSRP